MNREQLLAVILTSFNVGVDCVKTVNSPRGWSETAEKRERAALNRMLKQHGCAPLTDDEYKQFCL